MTKKVINDCQDYIYKTSTDIIFNYFYVFLISKLFFILLLVEFFINVMFLNQCIFIVKYDVLFNKSICVLFDKKKLK